MNCYLHPESPAVAFCRTCGRSLCTVCQRPAEGTIYCQDHVPVPVSAAPGAPAGYHQGRSLQDREGADTAANPYLAPAAVPPPPVRTSPGLAFLLGFIPGVGAIYNGQYLKGLVHALITGLLITIVSTSPASTEVLVSLLLAAFYFYMPFEAYHTAKKRELGLTPDEWSSILPAGRSSARAPIGPILLIAIGVLYLLNSLDLIDFRQIGRYWPVLLIVIGVYMLYARLAGPRESQPVPPPRDFSNAHPGAPTDFMGSRHE
ncbi:MAG TPA: B-box zinc finger protein [Bryobacteraceae bacterium]|jgi:TM2 domain-containing membrane protein YozV|nr:B-box zinc finger protein [Bryobacteraceae bacterium]